MARGLADRGHVVHVIACASDGPTTEFRQGYWLHKIEPDPKGGRALQAHTGLPIDQASWAASVQAEVQAIKVCGIDAVSFPIWDLEGLALIDDPDLNIIMSLHTTYGMAKPFKVEWNVRPLFEYLVVSKMIALEKVALQRVPTILANSDAIVDDLAAP